MGLFGLFDDKIRLFCFNVDIGLCDSFFCKYESVCVR